MAQARGERTRESLTSLDIVLAIFPLFYVVSSNARRDFAIVALPEAKERRQGSSAAGTAGTTGTASPASPRDVNDHMTFHLDGCFDDVGNVSNRNPRSRV
ncbi:hypothetical protein V5799_031948 [Amblyomma americanum]|uniref:Uncharacterized protein n=1 Tax=Amblyomma americanum TaxID=6943 RepID=A0AAQ4DSK0_AMBAM